MLEYTDVICGFIILKVQVTSKAIFCYFFRGWIGKVLLNDYLTKATIGKKVL